MEQNGHYRLPNPWGFIEAAKIAIQEGGENYIGFSWFGEKEDPIIGQTKAYCCPECQKLIIDSLKKINQTFEKNTKLQILHELFNKANQLECGHYTEFKKELEESRKFNKRKTPERRLHDYYRDIINNQTGAKVNYEDGPEL